MPGNLSKAVDLADEVFTRKTVITQRADSVSVLYKISRPGFLPEPEPGWTMADVKAALREHSEQTHASENIGSERSQKLLDLLDMSNSLSLGFSGDYNSAGVALTFGGIR